MTRRTSSPLACALATFVCAAVLAADSERGPKAGESIPEFSARDETGRTRTFADLSGPKGLLFIFHRSAAW